MRGTAKIQVSWVVALALDILGDPGLFPPPLTYGEGVGPDQCFLRYA